MICAECGNQLQLFGELGAYSQCCHGYGYWHQEKPLPQDRWWGFVRYQGWTLYRNLYKWPAGLRPVLPNG